MPTPSPTPSAISYSDFSAIVSLSLEVMPQLHQETRECIIDERANEIDRGPPQSAAGSDCPLAKPGNHLNHPNERAASNCRSSTRNFTGSSFCTKNSAERSSTSANCKVQGNLHENGDLNNAQCNTWNITSTGQPKSRPSAFAAIPLEERRARAKALAQLKPEQDFALFLRSRASHTLPTSSPSIGATTSSNSSVCTSCSSSDKLPSFKLDTDTHDDLPGRSLPKTCVQPCSTNEEVETLADGQELVKVVQPEPFDEPHEIQLPVPSPEQLEDCRIISSSTTFISKHSPSLATKIKSTLSHTVAGCPRGHSSCLPHVRSKLKGAGSVLSKSNFQTELAQEIVKTVSVVVENSSVTPPSGKLVQTRAGSPSGSGHSASSRLPHMKSKLKGAGSVLSKSNFQTELAQEIVKTVSVVVENSSVTPPSDKLVQTRVGSTSGSLKAASRTDCQTDILKTVSVVEEYSSVPSNVTSSSFRLETSNVGASGSRATKSDPPINGEKEIVKTVSVLVEFS